MTDLGLEQREGPILPNQRLKKWIETGYDDQKTVALYATNIENLLEILRIGQIPPAPVDTRIPYQAAIAAEGKFMYFASPIYKALEREKPDLLRQMENNRDLGKEKAEMFMSYDEVRSTAIGYAKTNTVKSKFFERTGIWLDSAKMDAIETVYLTQDELPEEETDWFYQTERALAKKGVSMRQAFLQSTPTRKGVILFLNTGIFSGTQAIPGDEDETEIVITSHKPMTADVVSGIEVLSNDDMIELRKHYEI